MPAALTEPPAYPAKRAERCPFDPPAAYRAIQDEAPVTRVRLWDGSTPWLVTVKRVEAMRPAIQRLVDGLIDDLLAGPNPADLVQAFALPLPSLVIC
ncbi:MAG TPA: cytochrome P450, partial [Streptosporangiaceae bacterium]